jgi:hypothetical protein
MLDATVDTVTRADSLEQLRAGHSLLAARTDLIDAGSFLLNLDPHSGYTAAFLLRYQYYLALRHASNLTGIEPEL